MGLSLSACYIFLGHLVGSGVNVLSEEVEEEPVTHVAPPYDCINALFLDSPER